ncbi:Sphingomyelin phosphodiesterase 3, partial [Chelonia mydas]
LPLQAARRPFAYKHTAPSRHPELWELPGTGKAFSFVSANVCLLPNGLAKNSNLGQMKQRLLSPFYEHIVYDVGTYGLNGCCTLKVLNSGLFLASRYPVLAAQYHCYPNGIREDALSAKGLLSVQVQLGGAQGQRIVGYLNCTHLHAPAGYSTCYGAHAQIRFDQLTMGLSWVQLFQDAHAQQGDVVAFDVFCGDFNFDNCSSGGVWPEGEPMGIAEEERSLAG